MFRNLWKKIQKYINLDLRFVCNWLKANKISLDASKTEMLLFRYPRKEIEFDVKVRIDENKVTPSKFVKCLCIYIDYIRMIENSKQISDHSEKSNSLHDFQTKKSVTYSSL